MLLTSNAIETIRPDYLAEHFYKHMHKIRVYDSSYTGSKWIESILNFRTETRCVNAFRMGRHVFRRLSKNLNEVYDLQGAKRMTVEDMVSIFVYAMTQGLTYRTIAKRFQRSTATIHTVIHEVLDVIVGRRNGFHGMARYIIRSRDPFFSEVPTHISNDTRYSSYFQGEIGCIDGTHINACIPEGGQIPYRGRKGITTFNVMAVCDFDMFFTFVSVGWEGSAHDAKVFEHVVTTLSMGFPHPPLGYFLLSLFNYSYSSQSNFCK